MSKHTGFVLDDHSMESLMGRLLQIGVLLASFSVLIGGVLFLVQHAGQPVDYRTFTQRYAELHSFHGLMAALARGQAEAFIELGVLTLIATPIGRVIFAVFAFALERDWLYVAVSLIVLGALVFGLHSR